MKVIDKKTKIIGIAIISLIVAIGIIASIMGGTGKRLKKQLDLGYKYLQEQNYEAAIASFKKAIEIDPMKPEAYIGMAKAYVGNKDCESAEDTIMKAIEYFESYGLDASALKIEDIGHSFVEATCTTLETCEICGVTQGKTIDHKYSEATCTTPETCEICGSVRGDTLEHDLTFATIEKPATCNVCGEIVGDKVNVKVIETAIKNINDEYEYVGILDEDRFVKVKDWDFCIVDANNKVIKKISPYLPDYMTFSIVHGYIVIMGDIPDGIMILIYDKNGEIVYEFEVLKSECSKVPNFRDDWTSARYVGGDEIEIYNVYSRDIICSILLNEKFDAALWITREDIELYAEENRPQFESEEFIMNTAEYNDILDGYLAYFTDKNWGYVDSKGNVIAKYVDACEYTDAGYAAVSNDREKYSIIDIHQNVIANDYIDGKNSRLADSADKNYIMIERLDGTYSYLLIE